MYRLFFYIGLVLLCLGCKGEQQMALDATSVIKSSGIEIPMYDFIGQPGVSHVWENCRILN